MENRALRIAFNNQMHASLDMLERVVRLCSDETWYGQTYVNSTWRVVYHTLYFFRLYLFQKLEDHRPWDHHREGAQNMAMDSDARDVKPYTQTEMVDFIHHCRVLLDQAVDNLDLEAAESGFYWYPISKVEHMLVNLKHLQHHIGQLQDRLRNAEQKGIPWVRTRDLTRPGEEY